MTFLLPTPWILKPQGIPSHSRCYATRGKVRNVSSSLKHHSHSRQLRSYCSCRKDSQEHQKNAYTFADGNHCLSTAVNFLNMSQATINDALNGNWFTDGLWSIMSCLNKWRSVLNLLGPPTNPEDHKCYYALNRSITAASRECDLGQDAQHSTPKSLESFIRSLQATLIDFITLLSNLIVCSLCQLELQKK